MCYFCATEVKSRILMNVRENYLIYNLHELMNIKLWGSEYGVVPPAYWLFQKLYFH